MMLSRLEAFERLGKFLAGLIWGSWEVMVREEPSIERLTFIATVLAGSEAVKAVVRSREKAA